MAICYFYFLSLLFLLLITHWTHSASLRLPSDQRYPSFIFNNESTTPEPVLSRRRPVLSSSDRQRRWSKHDLLLDETIIEEVTSVTDHETTVLTNESNDIHSTMAMEQFNLTYSPIDFDENSTRYPSLRQAVNLLNHTDDVSIIEGFPQNNETVTTTVLNEIVDMNSTKSPVQVTDPTQEISNEFITNTIDNLTTMDAFINETEITSLPILFNQTSTMNVSESDTTVIFLDFPTALPTIIDDNQTSMDFESNTTTAITETIISDQEFNNVTIISETIPTIMTDEDGYSNETIVKPICDLSCQCSKQCPYGFEIANNTCECDPPCKNYQCFGNDTCTVTNEGRPICHPENGTEHDRPSRCYQPRDAGYHDVDLLYQDRWYYHPDQDTCHLFVYRGLGGNENNFQTLHECHVECITCAPSPDPGTCLGRLRMWYYDYKQNQCSQFDYSGCKGNENKFIRKQDCIDTCISRILNL